MYDYFVDAGQVTNADIASALYVSEGVVEGYYGPGPNGWYKVRPDSFDIDTGDMLEDLGGESCAVVTYHSPRDLSGFGYAGFKVPAEIIDGLHKVWDVDHDHEYTEEVIVRYAALWGYDAEFITLSGAAQGDWAYAVIIQPHDEYHIPWEIVEDIFAGRIYSIEVELDGPFGDTANNILGGIIGDEEIRVLLDTMIRECHIDIKAGVRA